MRYLLVLLLIIFSQLAVPLFTGFALSPLNPKEQSKSVDNSTRGQRDGWSTVGVYLGDMTIDRARDLGLVETAGVIVGMVEPGSPAAAAGIQPNDCILTLDGVAIVNRLQFFQAMVSTPPGKKIGLGLLRNGESLQVIVETGERPSPAGQQRRRLFSEVDSMLRMAEENRKLAEEAIAKGDLAAGARFRETETIFRQMSDDNRAYIESELREGRITEPIAVQNLNQNMLLASKRYSLGLTVVRLTPQLASFLKADEATLMVSEVRADGASQRAGIRAGDCIVRLNNNQLNTQLRTPSDFSQAIDRIVVASAQGGAVELSITLIREGTRLVVNLQL
ncbi:MAG: PDZ domain-containing protein [Acidobacteria bacterium]|nr:PDZ domain-containing protein [Acidobacteriota bacterium]